MNPDTRTDQQSLRDEFGTPQGVHAEVYVRLEQQFGFGVSRGRGVSRREYATALAEMIRDSPMVRDVLLRNQAIRAAYHVAAAIRAERGG